jgi:superfamily II DNA or RNA helicase
MDDDRETIRHKEDLKCSYDKELYRKVIKDRWDIYDDCPIKETGKLFYLMRKVVNSDESRIKYVYDIFTRFGKVIIFYNHSYELEILKKYCEDNDILYGQWNGLQHDDLPEGPKWIYLVQYIAGCEGWNCITTNAIIFYSQSYSYRQTEQAAGRIDRINTPFKDLYYFYLRSDASIDLAIKRALKQKKNFNESSFKV